MNRYFFNCVRLGNPVLFFRKLLTAVWNRDQEIIVCKPIVVNFIKPFPKVALAHFFIDQANYRLVKAFYGSGVIESLFCLLRIT